MNDILSIGITVISLGVIFGCLFLLYLTNKNDTGIEEGKSMGHSFDGIEEINNPLPKWWSYMFVITIVFSLGYLALFPGLVSMGNMLNWASSTHNTITADDGTREPISINKFEMELEQADKVYGPVFAAFKEKTVEELANDPEAIKVGRRLFLQNCAMCHGSDAKGNEGFPNLTDKSWLYGGESHEIVATLTNGRNGFMPPKGGLPIEDAEVPALVEYVRSLSGLEHDAAQAAAGMGAWMKGCFACHGMDGKGNKFMGAPNLTDEAWLYGANREAISQTIFKGRQGMMPSFKDTLGEDKIHVVAGYVYSLSNGTK